MKKIFGLCLILLSTFLLVSCGEFTEDNENNNNQSIRYTQCQDTHCSDEHVLFSLDKGMSWNKSNNKLTAFDIWDIKSNDDVPGMVFFYATSYQQFIGEVEKNRTTTFYSYNYPNIDDWNKILEVYNEAYFEDNILLFYYKYEPNISENYVYNVTIEDNALTLNVNRFEGMATALSAWLEIVTIKKADVVNVSEYNVSVRTITGLKSSIVLSANKDYIRDMYINGLSKENFEGLDNLKSVDVWTWGLTVDILFNETVTNERLNEIIDVLQESETIRSIGYTSHSWIRVTLNNKFYDKYKEKNLTLDDILDKSITDVDKFTIDIKNFTPIVLITLEMEQHGQNFYKAMIKQLKELDFPFIIPEDIN